jgi:hypothetical protein
MSLQPSNDPWTRLVAVARDARDERDASAPYGFSTRVAALALAQERRGVSLIERFAFRALGVASLLAIGSVALNYSSINVPAVSSAVVASAEPAEPAATTDDAVALVLDFAD